jgi:peptidyl-prolyl cis-trans isomerase A (cyclophilin A)
MKRITTICTTFALAAMILSAGCDNSVENPFRRPPPEPTPKPPEPASKPAPPVVANTEAVAPPVVVQTEKITKPVIVIETSMGRITAELWADSAPITVKNFLAYVDKKHYDGLIFHRVMQGFMIQGGGLTPDMQKKAVDAPIKNEASADKPNDRGTLAMARTGEIDSATSQFFINLVNNGKLNHRNKTYVGFGYCAFGKVIDGMKVVDKIAAVEVGMSAGRANVPTTPILIKTIRLKK